MSSRGVRGGRHETCLASSDCYFSRSKSHLRKVPLTVGSLEQLLSSKGQAVHLQSFSAIGSAILAFLAIVSSSSVARLVPATHLPIHRSVKLQP